MIGRSWFGCGKFVTSAVAACWLIGGAAAENAAPPQENLPVRTEEDRARGKENVRNVIDELRRLFADDTPAPTVTPAARRVLQPPYIKTVPAGNNRVSLIFRPRFTTIKPVFKALDGIITGQTYLEQLPEQNLLVLNCPKEDVGSYRDVLLAIDVPTPQVLIEAKVIEVLFGDGMQRNLSISYSNSHGSVDATTSVPGQTTQPTSGAGTSWEVVAGNGKFDFNFRWLETAQDAKVLSSPNLLISRNEVSRIDTGSDVPIQEANTTSSTTSITTKFKRVGVSLEVEPSIINRDHVTLRVYPSVSNISSYQTVSSGGGAGFAVPVISVRSVETYLRLLDKQVAMMGGLYSSSDTLQQERVPILSDIPLIGELFTGKNKTKEVRQLIFFIKVHILVPEEHPEATFYDPDRTAKQSEVLGTFFRSLDSFPIREYSAEHLFDEIHDALPGQEQKRRRNFFESLFIPEEKQAEKPAETAEKPAEKSAEKPAEKAEKPAGGEAK